MSDFRSVKNTYNFEYFARLLKDEWNANIFTYEFLKKNIKASFNDAFESYSCKIQWGKLQFSKSRFRKIYRRFYALVTIGALDWGRTRVRML